jgi:hypothetical protein
VEPEISGSCLKWPDSSPYLEPVESSPSRLIRSIQDIIFHGRPIFKISSFLNFPTNTLYAFSSASYLPHAPLVSSSFISLSPEHRSLCGINHEAFHFAISSNLLLLFPLRPKYIHHHHVLQHPEVIFLAKCERPSFIPHRTTGKIMAVPIIQSTTGYLTTCTLLTGGWGHWGLWTNCEWWRFCGVFVVTLLGLCCNYVESFGRWLHFRLSRRYYTVMYSVASFAGCCINPYGTSAVPKFTLGCQYLILC